MSTISEALKKAQKQRSVILPVEAISPHVVPPDPQKSVVIPPYASGRPSFILILACVTILSATLFYYLVSSREAVLRQGDLTISIPHTEVAASSPKLGVPDVPVEKAAMRERSTSNVEVIEPVPPKVARTDIPVLKGIFYSEKNPVAIINGSAMKEGEMVGAYRVEKISTYKIILKCDGEEIELRLE